MTMVVAAETPPLVVSATGVFHVGKTRVTLDTVVGASRMEQLLRRSPNSIRRYPWVRSTPSSFITLPTLPR